MFARTVLSAAVGTKTNRKLASAWMKQRSIRNRAVSMLSCIGLGTLDLTVLPKGEVRAEDPGRVSLLQLVGCGGDPLLHVADPASLP